MVGAMTESSDHSEVERSLEIEHRSIDYVPIRERHGRVRDLWAVWFTGEAHLATLAVGMVGIGLGLSFGWTVLAVLVGNAVGTFFMAFHSTQGPQLGLPQMIQSRPQFGYRGALLIWVFALISYLGVSAFGAVLAGQSVQVLAGAPPGLSYVVYLLLALVVGVFGYNFIHKIQRWLSYLLMAGLGFFTVAIAVTGHLPALELSLGNFRTAPFLAQFAVAAAYQLSWAIYVSDYSRYLPKDVGVRSSFWWTYTGAGIGGAWMMLIGTVAAALNVGSGLAEAVRQAGDVIFSGFGSALLILSLLGMISIVGLNFYGSSLTMLSIADSFRPVRPTRRNRVATLVASAVVSGVLAFCASGSFMAQFSNFLTVTLYLFTPWTAINLVDFYLVRRGHYSVRAIFDPHGIYGQWEWRGIGAYVVGFVAMIPFFSTGWFVGPVASALGGADIAMFVGLPVSAVVYLWACRSLDLASERNQIATLDAGLDEPELIS